MTTGSLAGTGALVRFILRRDRVRLAVWVLSVGLSVMASVATFSETYPTQADRQARAKVIDTPMVSLFAGPGYGLDHYTFGAMTANEMLPITAVAVGLMSIFLVVRNTRADEESGRTDILRAGAVGRHAPLVATLVIAGGANVALGALLALGLPGALSDLPADGSLAFGAALAALGLVFAGLAALIAQLTVGARAAFGTSAMIMAAAYLVRAVGDMGKSTGAISWLSPFGWATETRAFTGERWWALALPVLAACTLAAVAIAVNSRRDVGAGLFAGRPGPATASPRLSSPLGLAWRLQRATLFWWAASLFILGLVYGGVAEEAGTLYENVESINDYLERIGAAVASDQYIALTLFISTLIASGFAIQSALRLRGEETEGRAEPLLATPVSRWRWAGSHLTVALAGGVALMLAFGLGEGLTHSVNRGDWAQLPRLVGSALAYVPALWVFTGLAVVLFGAAPRATGMAWGALAMASFMGIVGPLLGLPDWVYQLSPVEHIPRVPVASLSLVPVSALVAIAAGATALGLAAFRRREVGST